MLEEREYYAKMADYAFDATKFFLMLVTSVGRLYIALLAGFFALAASGFVDSTDPKPFQVFMQIVSAGMIVFVWAFRAPVLKTGTRDHLYLEELIPISLDPRKERLCETREIVFGLGTGIALALTGLISLVMFAILRVGG